MTEKKQEAKSKKLIISLTPTMHEKLKAKAESMNLSMSSYINYLLSKEIDK